MENEKALEEKILELNQGMLDKFASDMRMSRKDLEAQLKIVGTHDQLVTMAAQVNKAYESNPKAFINFGDFGAKVAKDLNLNPEIMYHAILSAAYSDLLLNIAMQLNRLYKTK
jgi:hypothetical protein